MVYFTRKAFGVLHPTCAFFLCFGIRHPFCFIIYTHKKLRTKSLCGKIHPYCLSSLIFSKGNSGVCTHYACISVCPGRGISPLLLIVMFLKTELLDSCTIITWYIIPLRIYKIMRMVSMSYIFVMTKLTHSIILTSSVCEAWNLWSIS